MMRLSLVTPPDRLPVTLEDLKTHARVSYDDEDALMQVHLAAAVKRLDGADGLLGRCLEIQTWCLYLDRFEPEIFLPLPPLQSVDSIIYVDNAGVSETIDPNAYLVAGIGGEGRVTPAVAWPTPRRSPEAIAITFTAGYLPTDDSPPQSTVPEPIRAAILNHAAQLYDVRTTMIEADLRKSPAQYDDLIADYRIPSF